MRTILELVGLVVLAGLLMTAAVVGLTLWAVRRLARALSRRLARAGRPAALPVLPRGPIDLQRPRLLLRAHVPGPQRDVAALRLGLRRDVTSTVAAVTAASRAGRPTGELGSLARRVREQARQLDADLVVLAAEPDKVLRRRLLEEHSGRIAELRMACAQLREGLRAAGAASAPLPGLSEDLAHEVQGLWHRARAYRELAGH